MELLATEKEWHVVAARAVFEYLYEHDMFNLAKEFCMTNPYMEEDRHLLKENKLPVNIMHKKLHIVMKHSIMMESILLQLVELCSSAINFPENRSLLDLGNHLIKVLRSSGTGQVLKAVVSTLPVCTDWSETQPTTAQPPPVPPTVVENTHRLHTEQSVPDVSFTTENLFGHDIIITASEMKLIETITRCVESDNIPITIENTVFTGQPSGTSKTGGIITMENLPPASEPQSNLFSTSTPSTSKAVLNSLYHINQPNKTAQHVTLQLAQEIAPISTNPPSTVTIEQVPNLSKEPAEKIPPPISTLAIATGATRSNGTPLDHPIVPGAVSSRSTSSRKQSHIRILDFGTPPFKRASPSTYGPSPVIPSPALNVSQRAVHVEKLTPTTNLAVPNPTLVPTASEKPKPKKIIVKRRLKRFRIRPQIKRMVDTSISKYSSKNLIKKCKMFKNKLRLSGNLHQEFNPTNSTQAPNSSKSNNVQTKENAYATNFTPTISVSPAKSLLNVIRPPSASPPRTVVPSSPACPVDPLAMCPMTPRFLTRPLQPLCMLSPLLGTLDASAVSQIKSISHTKRSTDINTPGYPITPGNAITPSPPPDAVPYYESEPGTVDSAQKMDVPENESDESDTDSRLSGAPKPQLTLTASDGSTEIAIKYVETEQIPPAVKYGRDFVDQLIEIDNGNRVFQIAVSPIITLYEDFP